MYRPDGDRECEVGLMMRLKKKTSGLVHGIKLCSLHDVVSRRAA